MEGKQAEGKVELSWGEAPYALVPSALRHAVGDLPAPKALVDAIGEPVLLRDLGPEFWQRGHELDKAALKKLAQTLGPLLKEHADLRVIEDSHIPAIPLVALCLPLLTAKAFARALPEETISCATLKIGDILELPQIGPKRTLEFVCSLESVVDDAYRKPPPSVSNGRERSQTDPRQRDSSQRELGRSDSSQDDPSHIDPSHEDPNHSNLSRSNPGDRRNLPRTPREIKTFFRVLSAWTAGERGEQTLANSLPQPHPDWPPELLQLWKRVKLSTASDLAGSLVDRYSVPRLIERAFARSDSRHRMILQARVFASETPTSLDSLARALDISDSKVKSLQREALGFLEMLQGAEYRSVLGRARMLRRRLGAAIPEQNSVIDKALDWSVADCMNPGLRDFSRGLMFWLAGPYRLQNGWFVTAADLPIRSTTKLMRQRDGSGVIETAVVRRVLGELGIRSMYHELWIDRLGEFIGVPNGLMSSAERITGVFPQITAS